MTRTWLGALALAAVAVVILLGGWAVLREREYQQLLQRGDAALASDQTFVAIEAYSGALALKDTSMIAYLKRGETYRRRGEMGAALRDFRSATRLDPSAIRPAELLGDVNYGLERFARAAESYRVCVGLDDRSPRVMYKLGLALFRSGDAAAAIAPLRQSVALDERFAEAHYLLGLCFKDRGQPAEARRALEQAIVVSPALVAPREELAGLYAAQGKPGDAIDQLEAIAALEPDRPERQAAVALAYARTGRTDAAIGVLGRAAERYPDNAIIYLALGQVWLDAAEPRRDRVGLRKAIEALEPLTRGPSLSSDALALYGRALIAAGDLAHGEVALQQASEMLPIDPSTLLRLADAAERLGRFQTVRTSLERWVMLAPEADTSRATVLERLGDLAQRMGDGRGAIRAWRRAVEMAAQPGLIGRLAVAERNLGDVAAARDTVARGLQRNPGHPALLDLQRRLQ